LAGPDRLQGVPLILRREADGVDHGTALQDKIAFRTKWGIL
jgi:hypothetical protein